ncbi:MAG: hypothetical protein MUF71_20775 [Candidatus Kapabacteria bacterium]|jgi:hypothetical protein|nr:hypothetical protein [Candidatus Kapabacteria bacterium]
MKSVLMRLGVLFLCLGGVWRTSFAQPVMPMNTEVLADIHLKNILILPPRTVECDIVLTNRSRPTSLAAWRFWANGTFMLNLHGLNLSGARVEVDSSALLLENRSVTAIQALPRRTGYELKTFLQEIPSRLGIALLGSDSVENTRTCPIDSSLLLCRLRVVLAEDIPNPDSVSFSWALPLQQFQANAFKTEQQRVLEGKTYQRNDNYEMPTRFFVEEPTVETAPNLTATRLQAEYRGDKRIRVRWTTLEERIGRRTNAGFLLLRQAFFSERSLQDTLPTTFDTVATFLRNPALTVRGARNGAAYEVVDSVPKRGMIYVYRLAFRDATVRPAQVFTAAFPQDTVQVRVPNAVIAHAEVAPNPLPDNAVLTYLLLDRARVTAEMWDVQGRVVQVLESDAEHPLGTVRVPIQRTGLPHQGALFLVVRAVPVDDAAVEQSQAVLKLQLVR